MERLQRDHPPQGLFHPDPGRQPPDEDRHRGQGRRGQDQRLPQRLGESQARGRRSEAW